MRRLLVLGAITFVAGLAATFPARVAYSWFAPDTLRLAGIGGTLWRATAREGEVAGVYLRDVEWRFRPLALFGGRAALDFRVSPAGGFLDGAIAVSPGGAVTLSNLTGRVSIGALQDLVRTPGIEGDMQLEFDRLALTDGFPTAADGSIELRSLVVRGLSPAPIGSFRAELATGDDAVTGSIEDLGGALDVAGSLRIGFDRSYTLTGLVAPTAQAPAGLVEQLRFLGSANERGQRPFRFEGRLQGN